MLKVKFKLESSDSKSDQHISEESRQQNKRDYQFMNLGGHPIQDING